MFNLFLGMQRAVQNNRFDINAKRVPRQIPHLQSYRVRGDDSCLADRMSEWARTSHSTQYSSLRYQARQPTP